MRILEIENISTRAMAENLHYMREGVYHPLIAIDPEGGERSSYSKPKSSTLSALAALAYPNPFKSGIVFDLSRLDARVQYQIVLTDLYGRIIMTQQVQGGQLFTCNTTHLPDGQFTYQIISEKEIVFNGKLLKITK